MLLLLLLRFYWMGGDDDDETCYARLPQRDILANGPSARVPTRECSCSAMPHESGGCLHEHGAGLGIVREKAVDGLELLVR